MLTRFSGPRGARPTPLQVRSRPLIAAWLFGMCALLFVMIVVGGLTRLTDSGLSIVEWRPVTGMIPPLTEAQWLAEMDKYRAIPEYQVQNRGMSLEAFKVIYWWEWSHRFLGRLIGLAFAIPFLIFFFTRRIERALVPRLVLMFALGGAQGALGWFMVMSGLSERLDVSQYRLTAHLGLAFVIFAFILWTAFDLITRAPSKPAPQLHPLAQATAFFAALVYLQILLGGFVAGLDAGFTYNTWPLMDGKLVPDGLFALSPSFVNFFENVTTVQFQHRLLAYVIVAIAGVIWWHSRALPQDLRRRADLIAAAVLAQVALGVWTLVAVVPVTLGAAHQAGAVILFTLALWQAHGLRLAAGAGLAAPAPKVLPAQTALAASAPEPPAQR